MKQICKDCREKKNEGRKQSYETEKGSKPAQPKIENMTIKQSRKTRGNKPAKFIAGLITVIIIVASIFVPRLSDYLGRFAENTPIPQSSSEETSNYQFRNDQYLMEHFEKHGAEFPYKTKEEYLEGANRVIASADALHKQEKEDGDDVYFLESTGEFVIVSKDSYIRTYFKPEDGIDYFNKQ